MRFLPKIIIFILLFLIVSTQPLFAATKAGINIATQYSYFDKALAEIAPGGWIYVMGGPAGQDFFVQAAKKARDAKVHLVIRGQCGGDPASKEFADAWAVVLGNVAQSYGGKIYFMPWNEPNGPASGDLIEPQKLSTYISALSDAFTTYHVRDSVVFLSPMINQYGGQYGSLKEYSDKLKAINPNFFTQFDGISMNLYAQYKRQPAELALPDDPLRNATGYDTVLNILGVPGKDVYGIESGVVIPNETPGVRYGDATAQLENLYGVWAKSKWSSDGKFKMFTIFSYSPDSGSPDYNIHWLFQPNAAGVLQRMKAITDGTTASAVSEQSSSPFDTQGFAQALETNPVDPNKFATCGGASSGVFTTADYLDSGKDGPLFKFTIKNVPIDKKNIDISIKSSDKSNRHANERWDMMEASYSIAEQRLRPNEFMEATKPNPVPTLAQDTVAEVCKVSTIMGSNPPGESTGSIRCQGEGYRCSGVDRVPCEERGYSGTKRCTSSGICQDAGDRNQCDIATTVCDECITSERHEVEDDTLKHTLKFNFDTAGFLHHEPGPAYGEIFQEGRFMQSITVPNKPITNEAVTIVTPPPLTKEQTSQIAETCAVPNMQYLNAVEVKSGGEIEMKQDISGIFDGLQDWWKNNFQAKLFPYLYRDIVVYFKLKGYKQLAKQNFDVLANPQSGTSNAYLPEQFQQVTYHGETDMDKLTIKGGTLEQANDDKGALALVQDVGTEAVETAQYKNIDVAGYKSTELPLRQMCAILPSFCCENSIPIPGVCVNGNGLNSTNPGIPGTPGVLTCNIPYRNNSVVPDESLINSKLTDIATSGSWTKNSIPGMTPEARKDELLAGWQLIKEQAHIGTWNPAFILALWIEESGADALGSWDLGCQFRDTGNESPVRPPASNPQQSKRILLATLSDQLECLFEKKYTDPNNFERFMCTYGPGHYDPTKKPGCTFEATPYFPTNLIEKYNQIIPPSSPESWQCKP